MKKLLIAFLLFAAVISASIIKPVERFATENNKVRLSRITVDSARLEKYKQGTLDMVQSLELVDTTPLIPGLKIK